MRNSRICDLFPALQQQQQQQQQHKVINFPKLENAHYFAVLKGLIINIWLSTKYKIEKIVFSVITLDIDSKEFIAQTETIRKRIP